MIINLFRVRTRRSALAHAIGITAAAVSQHLRILRDADIVIAVKQGYFVHYKVNEKTLTEWHSETSKLLEIKS